MGNMIADPETYFRLFTPPRMKLLETMEADARQEGIPIIGPVMGELLYIAAYAMGARRILELGAAFGYSTIYLAQACKATGGRVVTTEWNRDMAFRARENLRRAGVEDRVEMVAGDAVEAMALMKGPLDLIFMDLDKEYYTSALPHCHRLLRVGGLLITDNTGFRSSDPFNREVFNSKGWRVVNVLSFLPGHSPEHDGLCLALRVPQAG